MLPENFELPDRWPFPIYPLAPKANEDAAVKAKRTKKRTKQYKQPAGEPALI